MSRKKLNSSEPAYFGCFLTIVIGVAMALLGAYLLVTGASAMPLKVALLLVGGAHALLGVLALQQNRVAWSFALSVNGTLAVVFLFGAPKVRDAAEINLGLAIAPAFIFGIATMLLALSGRAFER